MQPISWWSCCCVSDSGAADCWTQWVRVATVVAACSPIKPSGLPSQCYSDFDLPLSEQMMHNSAVDYRRPQPSGKPGEVRGIWQWSGKSRGKRKKLGKFCASLSMSNCSCYHPFVHRPGKTWKSRGIFDGSLGKVMESKFYLWCVTAIAMVTE